MTRNMPEGFGGSYGVTVLDPLGLIILIVCIAMIMTAKRSSAFLPVLIVASILPQSLRIVIASADFSMIRIIVVFGLLRIVTKNEYSFFRFTMSDKLMVVFLALKTLIHTIQDASFSTLVQEVGFTLDAGGIYFIARCCIRTFSDVKVITTHCALLCIFVAPLYFYEYMSGKNLFSVFEGVNLQSNIREGEVRAKGSMPHPILAGCYWACFIPLFIVLSWRPSHKKTLMLFGILATSIIVVSCSSSTPMFSLLVGIFSCVMFRFRKYLGRIRIYGALALIVIHFAMEAPVWHLISRVTISSGSTGYFRFLLIDSFIRHANEWILIGTPYTGHWFFGAQDITNQFVLVAVRGGLITLIVFILQIVVAYRALGRLMIIHKFDKRAVFIAWGLGGSLLVHLTNFIGVSYFGQVIILWYSLLGIIASLEYSSSKAFLKQKQVANSGNTIASPLSDE